MKHDDWIYTEWGRLGAPEHAGTQERSALQDSKILMVDDEPLMTALIESHLQDAGYTNFVGTNDPRKALALLRHERPGVVLLDLSMPQLSGFDVLSAIRAEPDLGYTPVIVLTADTSAEARLKALRLGATDFLSKPVDESELVLRVRNTLAFQQYTDRALNYDPVTELANERLFARSVSLALERAPAVGGVCALFSIDVPDLRAVQQGAGQQAAADLAREFARRLRRLGEELNPAGPLATPEQRAPRAARLDAHRFGLLVEGLPNAAAVHEAARRLHVPLCQPVMLGTHEIAPQAWIGVAMAPTDGRDAESLRKSADVAAGHARQHGVLQVMFASAELNAHSMARLALGSQLRGVVQRRELRLHYQPKVDIATGRISGAEALVRWQHPERGLVPPGQFIPLAEELGLIAGIGDWVLHQACADAARWSAQGLGALKVAVNVAKPQFVSGTLSRLLRHALFDAGLSPERVVIELTESMLMDEVDAAIKLMHEIKDLGATLSIDDFGTGYSSLGYLKRFPLDELKIDRAFVMDLPGTTRDRAIARSVLELGHHLGMTVTAEGVETPEQLECLRSLGCDRYQGFLFSRPLPPEEFVALVRRSRTA